MGRFLAESDQVYSSIFAVQLFGRKVQKFLHCLGTKGIRDKLKILPMDGMVRGSLSRTGRGTGQYQILTVCPIPQDKTGQPEKDVLKQEKEDLKTEKDVLKQETMFYSRKLITKTDSP